MGCPPRPRPHSEPSPLAERRLSQCGGGGGRGDTHPTPTLPGAVRGQRLNNPGGATATPPCLKMAFPLESSVRSGCLRPHSLRALPPSHSASLTPFSESTPSVPSTGTGSGSASGHPTRARRARGHRALTQPPRPGRPLRLCTQHSVWYLQLGCY